MNEATFLLCCKGHVVWSTVFKFNDCDRPLSIKKQQPIYINDKNDFTFEVKCKYPVKDWEENLTIHEDEKEYAVAIMEFKLKQ